MLHTVFSVKQQPKAGQQKSSYIRQTNGQKQQSGSKRTQNQKLILKNKAIKLTLREGLK